MMKKRLLAAMALLPFVTFAQKPFTLSGDIKGLKTGDRVYLIYPENDSIITDSTGVSNGKFAFKGTLSGSAKGKLYLNINPSNVNLVAQDEKSDVLIFYVEPGNIKLTSADSLTKATITGSPVNDDAKKLRALIKPMTDKIKVMQTEYAAYTPEQKQDQTLMRDLDVRYKKESTAMILISLQYANNNPKSYISLDVISQLAANPDQAAATEKAFNGLSGELKATFTGKKTAESFDTGKRTATGAMATDFTLADTAGKPVKLSDFKGKYVLLDFWASWCRPCREENPNVVAAYHKFKDKGFTVLGVSLDSKKEKDSWLKAIADDQLTWTHVADLKDSGINEAARIYGIQSIPDNFLIDPTGKIIAKGLSGQALQDKLQELLGSKSK